MIANHSARPLLLNLSSASVGLMLAVSTLLFAQGMGIVFGLDEDLIKSRLKADASEVQTLSAR